jgi:hypothetical protein
MPAYSWSCLVCEGSNPAGSDACASCGCPANVSGKEVAARRAALHGGTAAHPPPRSAPTGHSFGTWVLVALFAVGALQGFWYLLAGVPVPEDAPAAVREYASGFGPIEKAWRFAGAVTSLAIAWLLFRLKRFALTLLWWYVGATSVVVLAQLAFSESSRALWSALGWWTLVVSVAFWVIPVAYLHRVRAQGRLGA